MPPANSQELIRGDRGGLSSLSIENGTSADAIAAIWDVGSLRTIRRVYVRAASTGLVTVIPEGTYRIRFAFGSGHLGSLRRFCSVVSAFEFDHKVEIREVRENDRVRWRDYEITLQPVLGGNAPSHGIDPALVFADSTR